MQLQDRENASDCQLSRGGPWISCIVDYTVQVFDMCSVVLSVQ